MTNALMLQLRLDLLARIAALPQAVAAELFPCRHGGLCASQLGRTPGQTFRRVLPFPIPLSPQRQAPPLSSGRHHAHDASGFRWLCR